LVTATAAAVIIFSTGASGLIARDFAAKASKLVRERGALSAAIALAKERGLNATRFKAILASERFATLQLDAKAAALRLKAQRGYPVLRRFLANHPLPQLGATDPDLVAVAFEVAPATAERASSRHADVAGPMARTRCVRAAIVETAIVLGRRSRGWEIDLSCEPTLWRMNAQSRHVWSA
jgi:hypothetical protein